MDTNRVQDKQRKNFMENSQLKDDGTLRTGRKSIDEDVALQLEYITIHRKFVMSGRTKQEIAKELGMSVGKIGLALSWVRRTWEELGPHDGLADEESYIGERIQEINKLIMKAMEGELVVSFGVVVRDANGNEVKKVSKNYLTSLFSIRQKYENMRMDIRGLMKKNSVAIVQGNLNSESVTYNLQNKVAILEKMSVDDRNSYLTLMGKYAESPDRF